MPPLDGTAEGYKYTKNSVLGSGLVGGPSRGSLQPSVVCQFIRQEVWKHIESEFEGVKNKNPPGQTEGATGQAFSADKVLSALKLGSFEIRNVCCNLAWTLPLYESIEGDTMSIALIEKYARAKFWSQEEDKPTAPALWPSVTIPIAFMQREELPPKTTWARYGGDIAAAAFWYAFAAAKKAGQPDHELEAFRRLCRRGFMQQVTPKPCGQFQVLEKSKQPNRRNMFYFFFLKENSAGMCR